jgi:hypothetical protein
MGAWGAIIMAFFGAVFVALTVFWQFGIGGIVLAAPFLVFAGIAYFAARVLRGPGTGLVPSKEVERAISWSSIGEGIGLFLAANIVINLHRPELLLSAMALVVGLHFLPIAFAARFVPFFLLGGGLVALAIIGFIIPPPIGGMIAGFGAAAALWVASILALRRDQKAKFESLAPA